MSESFPPQTPNVTPATPPVPPSAAEGYNALMHAAPQESHEQAPPTDEGAGTYVPFKSPWMPSQRPDQRPYQPFHLPNPGAEAGPVDPQQHQ